MIVNVASNSVYIFSKFHAVCLSACQVLRYLLLKLLVMVYLYLYGIMQCSDSCTNATELYAALTTLVLKLCKIAYITRLY